MFWENMRLLSFNPNLSSPQPIQPRYGIPLHYSQSLSPSHSPLGLPTQVGQEISLLGPQEFYNCNMNSNNSKMIASLDKFQTKYFS
jgi:hypothetical protein